MLLEVFVYFGGLLGEMVWEKVEEIGRELDELMFFLKDVFLTAEE